MVSKLSEDMTTDGLTDLINHATMFRDEKHAAEERIANAKANVTNTQATQRANKKKSAKKKKVTKNDCSDCTAINSNACLRCGVFIRSVMRRRHTVTVGGPI